MGYLRPLCLVLLLLLVLPAPASSFECPTNGFYSTQNLTMKSGRASEAWCPPGVTPGLPGNTENAQSWDGAALGGEWKLWGMTVDAAGAILNGGNVDAFGNGWMSYLTHYDGGQFWLSKDGAWGDGVNDLTGQMTNYTVSTMITLVMGNVVGSTSNITATGLFDNCQPGVSAVNFVIANAMMAWHPSWATATWMTPMAMPAGYPPFLCGAPTGELFDVCCITMNLGPVSVEDLSWGALKTMYR